jgi:predicted RNA-binding Zn-ribbon protein involved in translation (DUF1610 family)
MYHNMDILTSDASVRTREGLDAMKNSDTLLTHTNAPVANCPDCGMLLRKNLRACLSCGRPIPVRQSFASSLWALLSFWLVVLCTLYGLVALLRFVTPVTVRVTCTKQVVPPRVLLVPTTTYTELLSAGDCSVPRGSLILTNNVPTWLRAAAVRDQTQWGGWIYANTEHYGAPIRAFVPMAEQWAIITVRTAGQSAWADLCAPAWIARWCPAN